LGYWGPSLSTPGRNPGDPWLLAAHNGPVGLDVEGFVRDGFALDGSDPSPVAGAIIAGLGMADQSRLVS